MTVNEQVLYQARISLPSSVADRHLHRRNLRHHARAGDGLGRSRGSKCASSGFERFVVSFAENYGRSSTACWPSPCRVGMGWLAGRLFALV